MTPRQRRRLLAPVLVCLAITLVSCDSSENVAPRVTNPRDLNGVWWNENTSTGDLKIVGEPPQLTPAGEAGFRVTSDLKRGIDAAAASVTDIRNCVPLGLPRVWAQPFPMEIVQKSNLTVLMYEHMHSFRFIYMDEPLPDPDEVAMLHRYGNSVGHWENDSLVIESTAFDSSIFLDEQGLPASERLRTVERLRKINDATLEVVTTIDDPEYFVAPWTVRAVLTRQSEDTALMEYICGYGVYETRHATTP